jgi:hypothetical protein
MIIIIVLLYYIVKYLLFLQTTSHSRVCITALWPFSTRFVLIL